MGLYTVSVACGRVSKSDLRPAEGRPEGRFRGYPDWDPPEIRPGCPISGPDARLRNIGYEHFQARVGWVGKLAPYVLLGVLRVSAK